jgi:hypothetical protein
VRAVEKYSRSPDLQLDPCFKVVISQEEMNPAANCFVKVVDSVGREEENSSVVFQASEEHKHEEYKGRRSFSAAASTVKVLPTLGKS